MNREFQLGSYPISPQMHIFLFFGWFLDEKNLHFLKKNFIITIFSELTEAVMPEAEREEPEPTPDERECQNNHDPKNYQLMKQNANKFIKFPFSGLSTTTKATCTCNYMLIESSNNKTRLLNYSI